MDLILTNHAVERYRERFMPSVPLGGVEESALRSSLEQLARLAVSQGEMFDLDGDKGFVHDGVAYCFRMGDHHGTPIPTLITVMTEEMYRMKRRRPKHYKRDILPPKPVRKGVS
jgi:hypothetical protein